MSTVTSHNQPHVVSDKAMSDKPMTDKPMTDKPMTDKPMIDKNLTDKTIPTKPTDTKAHVLNVGYQLIAQKGFTAVGLKQILDTAGIPKGSFYHYFDSKEAFGEEVINGYFEHYKTRLASIASQDISAQQKLITYFEYWYNTQQASQQSTQQLQETCDHEKCLMVKLSGEVSDISDPMRRALEHGYQQTTRWISEQIKAGWADGSIPEMPNVVAQSLANRWYYAWLGASLIAKTTQSNIPLAEVWQMTTAELGC